MSYKYPAPSYLIPTTRKEKGIVKRIEKQNGLRTERRMMRERKIYCIFFKLPECKMKQNPNMSFSFTK